MFSARQSEFLSSRPYAIAADFCRIFEGDMNRMYLLSYLLTADRAMAEECFVRGLEDSIQSSRVFRDWAESWARRTIIHNAIQMIHPRPSDSNIPSSRTAPDSNEPTPLSAVVALPVFERFVFVMTVLERQSQQECSLLLGCRREEVSAARIRALQLMGRTAEELQEPERINLSEPASGEDAEPELAIVAIPHLAVSA